MVPSASERKTTQVAQTCRSSPRGGVTVCCMQEDKTGDNTCSDCFFVSLAGRDNPICCLFKQMPWWCRPPSVFTRVGQGYLMCLSSSVPDARSERSVNVVPPTARPNEEKYEPQHLHWCNSYDLGDRRCAPIRPSLFLRQCEYLLCSATVQDAEWGNLEKFDIM
jgi:hypothetical protein